LQNTAQYMPLKIAEAQEDIFPLISTQTFAEPGVLE
jgi:hypothetical protein